MDAKGSWFKVYDSLFENWEWFTDGLTFQLWMYLLYKANRKENAWRGRIVRRGELVTSVASLCASTGQTEKQIRLRLKRLEKSEQIITKRSSQFTIITICNYDTYQSLPTQEGQTKVRQEGNERTNEGQAEGKRRANEGQQYKNSKKEKNERMEEEIEEVVPTSLSAHADDSFNWRGFMQYFNTQMEGKAIPKINAISKNRKKAVRARMSEYGKQALAPAIINAATSSFLNGNNDRNFIATFDWIFKPSNFPKVLEGNYSGKQFNETVNGTDTRISKAATERLLREKEHLSSAANAIANLHRAANEHDKPLPFH